MPNFKPNFKNSIEFPVTSFYDIANGLKDIYPSYNADEGCYVCDGNAFSDFQCSFYGQTNGNNIWVITAVYEGNRDVVGFVDGEVTV